MTNTYLYNSPGVYGIPGTIADFVRNTFGLSDAPSGNIWNIRGSAGASVISGLGAQLGQGINNLFSVLGGASGFDGGKIQNVYGIAGPEFASMNNGILQQPGAWGGIYIEDGSLLSAQIGGHSASQMTDSLAVYNLFAQLDSTLNNSATGVNAITDIIKASSNVAADSLESAVTAFGKLFSVPDAVVNGNAFNTNRDQLYKSLDALQHASTNCQVTAGESSTQEKEIASYLAP